MAINDMLGVPRGNIGNNIPIISPTYTYTMKIGAVTTAPTKGSTVTVDQATWRRVGDCMEIAYTYIQTATGSAGSGTYLFPVPDGFTIDTSLTTANTARTTSSLVGFAYKNDSNPNDNSGIVNVFDKKNLFLAFTTVANGMTIFASASAGNFANASMTLTFKATVPIVEFKTI